MRWCVLSVAMLSGCAEGGDTAGEVGAQGDGGGEVSLLREVTSPCDGSGVRLGLGDVWLVQVDLCDANGCEPGTYAWIDEEQDYYMSCGGNTDDAVRVRYLIP